MNDFTVALLCVLFINFNGNQDLYDLIFKLLGG